MLKVPTHFSQIFYRDWCAFKAEEEDYFKAENPDDAIGYLVSAVSILLGEDCSDLSVGNVGDQVLPGEVPTVMGLYEHLIGLCNNYKPNITDDYTFRWKNKTYSIDPNDVTALFGRRNLTAGEAITVLEFERYFGKASERDLENADFNLGLEQAAVLLREKGVKLPASRRARITYIDKHKNLFANCPATLIVDVRFFFLNVLTQYLRIQNTEGSLRIGSPILLQENKRVLMLSKRSNSRNTKNSSAGNTSTKGHSKNSN